MPTITRTTMGAPSVTFHQIRMKEIPLSIWFPSWSALTTPSEELVMFSELVRRVSGSFANDLSLAQPIPTKSCARIMWRMEVMTATIKICGRNFMASGAFFIDIPVNPQIQSVR